MAPWLDPKHLAEMKPIEYQSRDGLTIRGYLTLPKGVESKNLPVVIHPHGGPWARDDWGYNSTVQFLTNRGYAVYRCICPARLNSIFALQNQEEMILHLVIDLL